MKRLKGYFFSNCRVLKFGVEEQEAHDQDILDADYARENDRVAPLERQDRVDCDYVEEDERGVLDGGQVVAVGAYERYEVIQRDENVYDETERDRVLFELCLVVQYVAHEDQRGQAYEYERERLQNQLSVILHKNSIIIRQV